MQNQVFACAYLTFVPAYCICTSLHGAIRDNEASLLVIVFLFMAVSGLAKLLCVLCLHVALPQLLPRAYMFLVCWGVGFRGAVQIDSRS